MEMYFNGRSALLYYGLLLEQCFLTSAKKKQQLIDIPGADGEHDLLENWGEPTYEGRTLTAYFSICDAVVWNRQRLVNDLEGRTVPIILPGHPDRYMTGTVHVAAAGAHPGEKICITAQCDPWLYSRRESRYIVPASGTAVPLTLRNNGRKLVVPELEVADSAATITVAGEAITFAPGTHQDGRLAISGGGALSIAVQGGAVTVRYREAVLL